MARKKSAKPASETARLRLASPLLEELYRFVSALGGVDAPDEVRNAAHLAEVAIYAMVGIPNYAEPARRAYVAAGSSKGDDASIRVLRIAAALETCANLGGGKLPHEARLYFARQLLGQIGKPLANVASPTLLDLLDRLHAKKLALSGAVVDLMRAASFGDTSGTRANHQQRVGNILGKNR